MYWFWQSFLTVMNTLGLIVGLAVVRPPLALAPPTEITTPGLPSLDQIQSMEDLYQLRDRLVNEAEQVMQAEPTPTASFAAQHVVLGQAIQTVDIKIHVEEEARQDLAAAMQVATEAVATLKPGQPSLEVMQEAESLWAEAIALLEEIPQETLIASTVRQKIAEYTQHRREVSYQVDLAQSGFLEAIAGRMGDAEDVRITVCQVSNRDCRYWKGNQPPASPASLIKVPVAVALMQKVVRENISLDTKILVSPGNYTEDPDGSNIWTGREYTLRELMLRMIDHSSNVATNQLIDYVGRDAINQTLRDRGYRVTLVDYKLVGEHTYPANAGSIPNEITTDELTDMMVGIYNKEHPGDEAILDALVRQYDQELGYKAIQGSAGQWIGEKTGQNSDVLGTTVGVIVGGAEGERYVITVTLDYSGNEARIRQCVRDVVDHITQQGHL